MRKSFIVTVFGILLVFAKSSAADQLSVPLRIDYSLIKKILISQLYTAKDNTAELWNDRQGCSYLRTCSRSIEQNSNKCQHNHV